jgi:hypothetical protein
MRAYLGCESYNVKSTKNHVRCISLLCYKIHGTTRMPIVNSRRDDEQGVNSLCYMIHSSSRARKHYLEIKECYEYIHLLCLYCF